LPRRLERRITSRTAANFLAWRAEKVSTQGLL
jgi:hypothetical protein